MVRGAVAAVLVLLVAAGSAPAASVRTLGDCDKYGDCAYVARFVAAPGERNDVTTAVLGDDAVIHDAGAPLTAGRLCTSLDAHTARCTGRTRLSVHTGDGDDRIDVSGGDLEGADLDGGPGSDVIVGRSVGDVLTYAGTTTPVRVDLRAGLVRSRYDVDRVSHVEAVVGGSAGDRIVGDAAANHLSGGPGRDVVLGGAGPDVLVGGSGRDTLRGQAGDDLVSNVGESTLLDRDGDDVGCGSGTDAAEVGEPFLARDDCERLSLRAVEELQQFAGLRPRLVISSATLRDIARVTVSARMAGRRQTHMRWERTHDRRQAVSLPLRSPAIDAARRSGPVAVTIAVRTRYVGGRTFGSDFRILLRRLPAG